MTKEERKAAADFRLASTAITTSFDQVFGAVREAFASAQTWVQFRKYAKAIASDLPKRNAWTIGQHIGDRTPGKCQRLLNSNAWDEDEVLRISRSRFVTELTACARKKAFRIFDFDETGQEKTGQRTAGVKRQYMGCAGWVQNGINTVHMSFNIEGTGQALINARQWVPEEHFGDEGIRQKTGLPEDLTFKTKGQLAAEMFTQVHDEGYRADFLVADEVYGASPDLREAAEERRQPYVLAVARNFAFTASAGTEITAAKSVRSILKQNRKWAVYSCGKGSKGERLYAWGWIASSSPEHSLLIRRNIATGECAYYWCFVPGNRAAVLRELVTAAGLRWPIEECFEFGKDYFGLDQSQVRLYKAIRRYTIIVIVTLGIFAVTAARMSKRTSTQAPRPASTDDEKPASFGLIPLTVNEIRKAYNQQRKTSPPALSAHWSLWRRRHQAAARWYHTRTRIGRNLAFAKVKP